MSHPSPHAACIGLALVISLLAGPVRPATAATPSHAPIDSAGTGTIHGLVTGPSGPVAFANVFVLGTRRGTASDDQGRFAIRGVPAGVWSLRVEPLGFEPTTRAVHVTAGSDTNLVIELAESAALRRRLRLASTCDSTQYPWGAGGPAFAGVPLPDTSGWWTASGSIFDFSLPRRFHRRRTWAIDSEVAAWDADSTWVEYHLGSYGILDRPKGGKGETECLGGQRAMVEVRLESKDRRYSVEVYFPDIGLTLFGSTRDAQEYVELLASFRTIRFHDADAPRHLTGPPVPSLLNARPDAR